MESSQIQRSDAVAFAAHGHVGTWHGKRSFEGHLSWLWTSVGLCDIRKSDKEWQQEPTVTECAVIIIGKHLAWQSVHPEAVDHSRSFAHTQVITGHRKSTFIIIVNHFERVWLRVCSAERECRLRVPKVRGAKSFFYRVTILQLITNSNQIYFSTFPRSSLRCLYLMVVYQNLWALRVFSPQRRLNSHSFNLWVFFLLQF